MFLGAFYARIIQYSKDRISHFPVHIGINGMNFPASEHVKSSGKDRIPETFPEQWVGGGRKLSGVGSGWRLKNIWKGFCGNVNIQLFESTEHSTFLFAKTNVEEMGGCCLFGRGVRILKSDFSSLTFSKRVLALTRMTNMGVIANPSISISVHPNKTQRDWEGEGENKPFISCSSSQKQKTSLWFPDFYKICILIKVCIN